MKYLKITIAAVVLIAAFVLLFLWISGKNEKMPSETENQITQSTASNVASQEDDKASKPQSSNKNNESKKPEKDNSSGNESNKTTSKTPDKHNSSNSSSSSKPNKHNSSNSSSSSKPNKNNSSNSSSGKPDINSSSGTVQKEITSFPHYLREGLQINGVFLYSGPYMEDTTFDVHKDILAIRVENASDKDLQLAEIRIKTDKKECLFNVTVLPAGETLVALEKEMATFEKGEKILEIRVGNLVFFNEKISTDKNLKITARDGILTVKNISKKDIKTDTYVFYKHTDGKGELLGGITFRAKLGAIKAGKSISIPASAYFKSYSKVVFTENVPQ